MLGKDKRNFRETITSRYGVPEQKIYEQVMELVKNNNIAKSRAQLLLVERGLKHTQNPEPLVKEKVVYRDRVKEVPKEVPKIIFKDRVVYRDAPKEDHIKDQGVDEKTGQPASGDILRNQDKAESTPSSNTALEEKKSPQKKGANGWAIAGGLSLLGLVVCLALKH